MYFSVINIKSQADNNRERMSQKLNVNCEKKSEKWKNKISIEKIHASIIYSVFHPLSVYQKTKN